MVNKYYNRLKERVAFLESIVRTKYSITRPGDEGCEHSFDEWELTSSSGIVFCDWACTKCGLVISQLIGERLRPENIPEGQETWIESNI